MEPRLRLRDPQALTLLVRRRRDGRAGFTEVGVHLRCGEAQVLAQVVRVGREVVDVQGQGADVRVQQVGVPFR